MGNRNGDRERRELWILTDFKLSGFIIEQQFNIEPRSKSQGGLLQCARIICVGCTLNAERYCLTLSVASEWTSGADLHNDE